MGYVAAENLCDVIQNSGSLGYLPLDVFVLHILALLMFPIHESK